PFHRYADGDDLAALALERVSDLPGVVVRVTGARERSIDWHHFAPVACEGRAVLVHTGWDRHWGSEAYCERHPFLTAAAATWLRDHGARLVGIDSLNIDDTSGGTRPLHSILLAAGIPIVEHLTRLDALPAEGFRFHAAPPKAAGMGTFPVRAHARCPYHRRHRLPPPPPAPHAPRRLLAPADARDRPHPRRPDLPGLRPRAGRARRGALDARDRAGLDRRAAEGGRAGRHAAHPGAGAVPGDRARGQVARRRRRVRR